VGAISRPVSDSEDGKAILVTLHRLALQQPIAPALEYAVVERRTFRVVEYFVLFQVLGLVALLFGATTSVRPYLRIASFGASAVLLLFSSWPRKAWHPSTLPALLVIALAAASLFNPGTAGLVPGLAELLVYVCVLAPLLWTVGLSITPATMRNVILILWAFHSTSAALGVLQVRFPGRFQPQVSTVVASDREYMDSLRITNAQGERVFRPMGLTDVPGGASLSGFYASLLGVGVALMSRRPALRILGLGSVVMGLSCIYMSQVRAVLVMVAAAVLALAVMLALRGESRRLFALLGGAVLVALLGFALAVSIGGSSVTNRLSTFTEGDAGEMYYRNRGHFLQETIDDLLPQYPLGAGLGRWGMMNLYFADHEDPKRPMLWAEIQWTGWLLDGGVPLVLAYVAALALAFSTAIRLALSRVSGELWFWAGVVVAYNLGALAMTFDYPFFNSQGGLELWMLNGALFAAARHRGPLVAFAGEGWR
jgi:hypothetical protein